MRAVNSVLSFGLVTIPVKVYLAAAPDRTTLHWISPHGNRVAIEYVDSVTGERLTRDQIRHGFEVSKDQYVAFSDEELKRLLGAKGNLIEIRETVPHPPITYSQVQKVYYLTPGGIQKPYRLLLRSLKLTNRFAVGKWYCRGRDYLVALYPTSRMLVMLQLYYASEVREVSFRYTKRSRPSPQEVELAKELLDRLSAAGFNAASYQDEYASRLKAALEAKQVGQDLTTLLRKSLKRRKTKAR